MHGKSNYSKQKENTKSVVEKNEQDEELKKYDALINKLPLIVSNKDKSLSQMENDYSTKRTTSLGKNKSTLLRLTVSRTKDDRNDKDFLSALMNNDRQPILPKNLHLLSDNDTNQNISNTEKFKNLSNLMINDKESYIEKCCTRNTEDRLILELYTTLSREAKEIFLEEENMEKLAKKRLLFHKLNDIKVPKIGFNKNENNKEIENKIKKENNNYIKEEEEEEDEDECYYKQEEKGYFHIPNLVNLKEYKMKEKNEENIHFNNDIFWDPEIDGDTLSYINHNIIRIEDMYNSEEKYKNKNETQNKEEILDNYDEDNISPIDLQEIKSSSSSSDDEEEENNLIKQRFMRKSSNIIDEEEVIPKKNIIKFSVCREISSCQIEVIYPVDPIKDKECKSIKEIKNKNNSNLEKIFSFNLKYFPKNASSFTNDLMFKIAKKNALNVVDSNERFTIMPIKIITSDKNIKSIQKLRKDVKKKTVTTKIKSDFGINSLRESQFIHKHHKSKATINLSHLIENQLNKNNNKNSIKEKKQKSNREINKNKEKILNETINKTEENQKDNNTIDNDLKSNENMAQNLNKIFTLKNLLVNESFISNKEKISNKKNNNYEKSYENINASIFNERGKNNLLVEDIDISKIQEKKEDNKDISNNISHLYSDKQSVSQTANDNKMNLSFSSGKS